MIYLITGLPGNGKTLYALAWVKAKAEKEGRAVFYDRIKGLKLPWTRINAFEWDKAPPNSIVVIDECQQSDNPADPKSPTLFGVRQRGAPVPAWAAGLETHRHKGIDLVLITQDPMLLDAHDRKLVQTHWHVIRTFGLARATVHEFNGCRPNVANSRSGSQRHEWAYPKDAYQWYESAEVHTGKARVPMRIWLLLSLPFIIGALVWYAWTRYLSPSRASVVAPVSGAASAPPASQPQGRGVTLTKLDYLHSFEPRVAGLAYTAPAYDDVTKPTAAPYPAACIADTARCQCYTQQGTRLEVPADLCRSVAAGGFFVAWAKPEPAHGSSKPLPVGRQDPAPAVGSLGGNPRSHILTDVRSK